MSYKNIIFDVDGTLLNTEKAILSSLKKLLEEETGKDYPFEELRFSLGIPGIITLKKFGLKNVEESRNKWSKYMDLFWDEISIFNGIIPILEKIGLIGIDKGIITSKTREDVYKDLKIFKLEKYFSIVITSDDTLRFKPFPDPIEKYIEKTKVSKSDLLFVGDSGYDYNCAKNAGIDFALAAWGTRERYPAKYLLEIPDDLIKIIS